MIDPKEVLKDIETQLKALPESVHREEQLARLHDLHANYGGEDRIVTSEELQEIMANEPPVKTVGSGFSEIDALTGGFSYEQLIVITAQEKSGKTAFALQLIGNMKDEQPCCFLFEQSPRELIRQMKERGEAVPYFVTPLVNIDNRLEWVQERAIEAMVKKGSRVFVIDNVDWIARSDDPRLRSDEIYKKLLIELKNFCKQWHVIIFLVAHVTKMNFQEIPQPNNVKDTGAFKQIADTMLILWRKTVEEKVEGTKSKALRRTSETLLWVAENRRVGKTGYVQLYFDGKKFIEKAWDLSLKMGIEAGENYEQY